MTAVMTLGAMTQRGIFRDVKEKYTKVLVGALLLELTGAFIAVYTTLPELKLKISEKYMFEMTYTDVASNWLEQQKNDIHLIQPFINNGGINEFLKFKQTVQDYESYRNVSKITKQDVIDSFKTVLDKKSEEHLRTYTEIYNESPANIEKAEKLLFEHERLLKSSNKVGRGTMWASTASDKLEGIIVYEFPEQVTPSVLEFHGRKSGDQMILYFDQKPSVFKAGGTIRRREAASFNLPLTLNDKGQYEAKLGKYGDMRIQLWEL
jgi:hypothetical protein